MNAPASSASVPRWWLLLAGSLALLALTGAAYHPAFQGKFIWDDNMMVTDNPLLQAPDALRAIWFSTRPFEYHPLTFSALWLQWKAWGNNPAGYHAVNILLHALSSLLLWRVLLRLAVPGAWLAAALFAVHPAGVSSVAWIAELKNALSQPFFLLCVWAWLRHDDALHPPEGQSPARAPGWYLLALTALGLGLLAKTSGVMLPVVLLLCAWWRRGLLDRLDFLRTLPFFAVSGILGLLNLWFHHARALPASSTPDIPLLTRLVEGSWAWWFYLGKAFWPAEVSIVYPQWNLDPSRLAHWVPALVAVALLALAWWGRPRWGRGPFFGLAAFTALLVPVLGPFQMVYFQISEKADHLQYVALPALMALGAAMLWRGWEHLAARLGTRASLRWVAPAAGFLLAVALLGLLGYLTSAMAYAYAHESILWRHAVRLCPDSAVAHQNLARTLEERGQEETAAAEYQRALELNPKDFLSLNNLANLYRNQKMLPQAHTLFQKALALNPHNAEVHNNLGSLLIQMKRIEEARPHLEAAIQLKTFPEAFFNLGNLLNFEGKLDEAVAAYRQAVTLRPDYATAHENLGVVLMNLKRYEEAVPHLQTAVRLNPNLFRIQHRLGSLYARMGKKPEAIKVFGDLVAANGEDSKALFMLAGLLAAERQPEVALQHLVKAAWLTPDFPQIPNLRAWILATATDAQYRNGAEALSLAQTVVAKARNAHTLSTLAAAQAENGQFPEAVATAEEALKLYQPAEFGPDAAALARHLETYRASQPWRE